MKQTILTLTLLLFCNQLQAGEAILSWTNPDRTFTLVDAGAYTNPAGTKMYLEVADTADPLATSITVSDLKPGTYNFVAVSYDDTGLASPVSSAATKEITEFVVTNDVVRTISKIPGSFLLLAVGTVPLGTPCTLTQNVNGHYAIPLDAVTWSDPARNAGTAPLPLIAVAKCG